MTNDGRYLHFQSKSWNRKRTLAGEARFPQYHNWAKVTGKFLGPGTYNADQTFKFLKAAPCAAIYVS
jgi:hypothetical protein